MSADDCSCHERSGWPTMDVAMSKREPAVSDSYEKLCALLRRELPDGRAEYAACLLQRALGLAGEECRVPMAQDTFGSRGGQPPAFPGRPSPGGRLEPVKARTAPAVAAKGDRTAADARRGALVAEIAAALKQRRQVKGRTAV